MSSEKEIKFVLRFSTQSLPDQQISCSESWSVADLKRHLRDTCSSKPAVEKQRLIYAGHCLKDDQILRDVFKKIVLDDEEGAEVLQVVHLVCAGKDEPVLCRPVKSAPSFVPTPAPSTFQNTQPNVPTDINTAYAQAYYDYLNQYYNQPAPSIRQIQVVARVQQQNAPNNARANPENPREQPDLLDTIYRLVRVAMLILLIIYSPFERLLLVGGLICLVLYVQQRRERQNQAVRPENQPAPPAQPEQAAENVNNEAVPNENNDSNNNNTQPPEQNPTLTPSAWSVFWSTVVSFFSSLIPENPVPLNVN